MNKKKLIRKIALPTAGVFVISILILISLEVYMDSVYEEHLGRLNTHIASMTEQNQKALDEIALKIQPLADQVATKDLASTRTVRELQSQFLAENQTIEQAKRYFWLSNDAGDFIFGAPVSVFKSLNAVYNEQQELFTKDGLFKDQNDFLLMLVDQHHELNSNELDQKTIRSLINRNRDSWYYVRERSILLSTPLITKAGNVLGTVFLKVDDSVNRKLYYRKNRLADSSFVGDLNGLLIFFAVISGIFLWFLLPTWVYIDAQQRDIRNPGIWAFITIISTIFGLAIYLITRPSNMKSFHCPQCENEVNGGAFCPYCGFDLASTMCPQCQYPIKPEWSFCPSCRTELRKKAEVVPKKEKAVEKKKKEKETS